MVAMRIRVVALPAAPILVLDVVVLLTLGGFLVPLFDMAPLLAIVFFLLLRLFFFFLLPLLPSWYALHVYFAAKNEAGFTFSPGVGTLSAFLAVSFGVELAVGSTAHPSTTGSPMGAVGSEDFVADAATRISLATIETCALLHIV